MKTSFKPILRTDLNPKSGMYRIDFRLNFCGQQIKLSTDRKIPKQYWDKINRRVLSSYKDSKIINKYLSSVEAKYDEYIAKKDVLDEDILLKDIKNLIKEKSGIDNNKNSASIEEIFDKYIDKLVNGSNRYNTLRNIRSTKKITLEFVNYKYGRRNSIEIIDFNFLENYKAYLKNTRNNSEGSINKRLRHLRTVIRYALKLEYAMNYPFDGLTIKTGLPRQTYLTNEEYERFKGIQVPEDRKSRIGYVKDMFIFSCEVGLRFSDVFDLRWTDIQNDAFINKQMLKTGKPVFVPLSKQAIDIIETWGNSKTSNNIFDYISNQKANNYLKTLAKQAKIEKHLTFHVSRHTFATRLSKVLSPSDVIKLLGDSDLRMANVYINADNEDLKKSMKMFWESA